MCRISLLHHFYILMSIVPGILFFSSANVQTYVSSVRLKSFELSTHENKKASSGNIFNSFPRNKIRRSRLMATCPCKDNNEITMTDLERPLESARIKGSLGPQNLKITLNKQNNYLTASNNLKFSLPVHLSLLGLFFSLRPSVLTVTGAIHAAFLGFTIWSLMGYKVFVVVVSSSLLLFLHLFLFFRHGYYVSYFLFWDLWRLKLN
jgi:hypothetical protein